MTPRDYQQKAIAFLCGTRRGILCAPAGAGKTFIAAKAISDCLDRRTVDGRAKIEIMVNTREQVEQFESACSLFNLATRCDLWIYCAASATVGTRPDLLVVDECHHAAAETWARKIETAPKARWALSATPWADAERDARLRELFTDRFFEIERGALVERGHLSRAVVHFRETESGTLESEIADHAAWLESARRKRYPFLFRSEDSEREQINRCKWQAAQQIGIFENRTRDAQIVADANARIMAGHHVIVLIGKIEHGERLQREIIESSLCFSKMGAKKRREAIARFRSGEIKCLVATSMLDEGFDAPIADCLIVASAGKSHRKAVQSTGRVLRKFDGKTNGVIIDFLDKFNPMLSRQSAKRARIYRSLNYAIK